MHISKEIVHIAIAATSVVIRRGLSSTLEGISSLRAHIVEVSSMEGLSECMEAHSPDILVVEPSFCGKFNLEQMKELYPSVKYVALVVCDNGNGVPMGYDDILCVYDEIGNIGRVFEKLSGHDYEEEADVLSQREREIVVCVVRGLTNKEIADELCISVHTVITHRKNISRKLQIHSVAGLTIYAIANKLIELKDLD